MKTVITKTNKGHRVWVKGLTDKYGWAVGARYNVVYTDDAIFLVSDSEGKRAVCKGKGGIVDLESKKVTRWANGATTATVAATPDHSKIIVIAGA